MRKRGNSCLPGVLESSFRAGELSRCVDEDVLDELYVGTPPP